MTLTLDLSAELEERLKQEAERQGIPISVYALRLLEEHLQPLDRRAELVSLIQSWIDEDDVEQQRETGDTLIKALDEDRLSDRKLYPAELEGVTW